MGMHVEVPLRIPAQSWPGLGTRIGFLDPQVGFLEDGSVNMMINTRDLLQKRKGFIRGLEKGFSGPVCGLFKYTDKCGIEYLLVADQAGISIEQPFAVPLFENSDAYPFDSFSVDGFPSTYTWRNIDRYVQANDELLMRAGVAASADPLATTDIMRWFKPASNLAYQVRIQYSFDISSATQQQTAIVIKGTGDLSTGSYLITQIEFSNNGAYRVVMYHFNGTTLSQIDAANVVGSLVNVSGFMTLAYERDVPTGTFTARTTVLPNGGSQINLTAPLTAVEDASFGSTISGIGLGYNAAPQPTHSILVVDGGPL